MIIKEYRCKAHGAFESTDEHPICPYGCDVVDRVFMSPPAFRSDATKRMDSNTEMLAKNYGLTDMNNRGGRPVLSPKGPTRTQQEEMAKLIHQKYGDGWGNIPKQGGAPGALAQYGAPGSDNIVGKLKESGAFVPKPVRMIKDHENLQVEVA